MKRLDLGLRALLPEWRALFSRANLKEDVVAGLIVACIAIPLSLAIALASGVAPAVGLVSAIVGGAVCAIFGGTPLSVSGPAAAMAVLVATVVQDWGFSGLLLVGFACGILQMVTGVFSLGRYIRLVPVTVVEGFTAGIGAIIFIGQLPRALGLPPPPASHVLDVITHIADLVHQSHPGSVTIVLGTLAIIYGLPRLTKKVPPHLVAVALPTLLVALLNVDAPTIGTIPRSLPRPTLPTFPANLDISDFAGTVLLVYALASLETLLSSTAVDKLTRGSARSDPDQELIGQGLGNLAAAVFGGIPVTGVIARSATNVQAGAKTRRASLFHVLALLVTVFAAAPVMERIPVAALAGVLISVAFRMLSPATLRRLWRASKADATVFAMTFVVIVFVDLLEGVRWGIVAALAVAAFRLGRSRAHVQGERHDAFYTFRLEGPITFLSSLKLETLRAEAELLEPGRGVIIDLTGVSFLDASGAETLEDVVGVLRGRGLRPVVFGARAQHKKHLHALTGVLADTDKEVVELLGSELPTNRRLKEGVQRYRAQAKPRYVELFEKLADGQAPHTLFITCSDSRINPNLITQTDPGELFIVRDVGNMVVPCCGTDAPASGAAVDYAVGVLGVREIVVCGHSACGAVRAVLSDVPLPAELLSLKAWVRATQAEGFLRRLPKSLAADDVARLNVLAQIENLMTYPVVKERVERGELELGAWFFDIRTGDVEAWVPTEQRWEGVGKDRPSGGAPIALQESDAVRH